MSANGELVCKGFRRRVRTQTPGGKTLETNQRMESPVSIQTNFLNPLNVKPA